MNDVIIGVAGTLAFILVLGGMIWLFVRIARRPARETVPQAAPPIEPTVKANKQRLWMLVQGDNGPSLVPCTADSDSHGYTVRGVFYPREFCQVVQAQGLVVLASQMMMPADGNQQHPGDYDDLVPVSQAGWTASWVDYDRARRRLNWDAVWNRGDGSMAGIKNLAMGTMVVCMLLVTFQIFSVKSGVTALRDVVVVKGSPTENVVPAAAARPTGDK